MTAHARGDGYRPECDTLVERPAGDAGGREIQRPHLPPATEAFPPAAAMATANMAAALDALAE